MQSKEMWEERKYMYKLDVIRKRKILLIDALKKRCDKKPNIVSPTSSHAVEPMNLDDEEDQYQEQTEFGFPPITEPVKRMFAFQMECSIAKSKLL